MSFHSKTSTAICTPDIAEKIGRARSGIEGMCIEVLRRCAAIFLCIQKNPTLWDWLIGNIILTVDERLEVAGQVHDIRKRIEDTLMFVDRCFVEGNRHPLEISLFVYGQVIQLSQWIDGIITGNDLPRAAVR